jgi:alpha-1,3-rhamnosyl/mannosyltransferase
MSADAVTVAFNCTAYDRHPSGARERAVGLTAGLLELGANVHLYSPSNLSLVGLVERELGRIPPAGQFRETITTLEPSSPASRAARSRRWFRRNLEPADLFVTDYYPVVDHVPTALTIHDLRYMASPADESRSRVLWFRTFYRRVVERAAHVVVPTSAVGAEASFHLEIEPSRMTVVPNGLARHMLSAPEEAVEREHLLWIGTAEVRKRLRFLLRAYAMAAAAGPIRPLVLVGRGSVEEALPGEADVLIEQGLVRSAGVVDAPELLRLLRGSVALLHPSRYEGFGMPVLEAIALGTPVIAARVPAVEEVARGGATFLDPDDLGVWAESIRQVGGPDGIVVSPRTQAVEEARATTWSAAARALLSVIDA